MYKHLEILATDSNVAFDLCCATLIDWNSVGFQAWEDLQPCGTPVNLTCSHLLIAMNRLGWDVDTPLFEIFKDCVRKSSPTLKNKLNSVLDASPIDNSPITGSLWFDNCDSLVLWHINFQNKSEQVKDTLETSNFKQRTQRATRCKTNVPSLKGGKWWRNHIHVCDAMHVILLAQKRWFELWSFLEYCDGGGVCTERRHDLLTVMHRVTLSTVFEKEHNIYWKRACSQNPTETNKFIFSMLNIRQSGRVSNHGVEWYQRQQQILNRSSWQRNIVQWNIQAFVTASWLFSIGNRTCNVLRACTDACKDLRNALVKVSHRPPRTPTTDVPNRVDTFVDTQLPPASQFFPPPRTGDLASTIYTGMVNTDSMEMYPSDDDDNCADMDHDTDFYDFVSGSTHPLQPGGKEYLFHSNVANKPGFSLMIPQSGRFLEDVFDIFQARYASVTTTAKVHLGFSENVVTSVTGAAIVAYHVSEKYKDMNRVIEIVGAIDDNLSILDGSAPSSNVTWEYTHFLEGILVQIDVCVDLLVPSISTLREEVITMKGYTNSYEGTTTIPNAVFDLLFFNNLINNCTGSITTLQHELERVRRTRFHFANSLHMCKNVFKDTSVLPEVKSVVHSVSKSVWVLNDYVDFLQEAWMNKSPYDCSNPNSCSLSLSTFISKTILDIFPDPNSSILDNLEDNLLNCQPSWETFIKILHINTQNYTSWVGLQCTPVTANNSATRSNCECESNMGACQHHNSFRKVFEFWKLQMFNSKRVANITEIVTSFLEQDFFVTECGMTTKEPNHEEIFLPASLIKIIEDKFPPFQTGVPLFESKNIKPCKRQQMMCDILARAHETIIGIGECLST
jgi:hypothetical protein